MDEARTPELWYRSLPPLTRFLVTVTFLTTLVSALGLFDADYITLDWTRVLFKGQIWRLITNYFYVGPFSLGWLMHIYFTVTFSSKLEVNELFTTSSGAYLFFLLFQAIVLDSIGLLAAWPRGMPSMGGSLSMAIIYYWSKREAYSPIGVWGVTLQAYQFPFALLFLDLVLGQSVWGSLFGVMGGHLYFFLRDQLYQTHKISILHRTPRFCDEVMDRFARFDRRNIVGSLKILLQGEKAVRTPAPPTAEAFRRHATFATLRQSSQSTQAESTTQERLFVGQGHRLG